MQVMKQDLGALMCKPITEEQRAILEAFKIFYYSGKIPHLAVTQKFPEREEEILGFETLLEEFEHDYMIQQDKENG